MIEEYSSEPGSVDDSRGSRDRAVYARAGRMRTVIAADRLA